MTRIMRLPPDSISMRMGFAPASIAFARSSLTTDAGRSTTSPAAILFATPSGRMRMRLIYDYLLLSFLERNSQLVELHGVDRGWRFGHEVLGSGSLAKGDDFADGFFSSKEHDHAIDPQGDAPMRGCAVG